MPAVNAQPGTSGRGFVPGYTVKYRGSQRAEDRFGVGCRDDIMDILHEHENEQYPQEHFSGRWEDFPRVSRARMNLTALSQHYNLYFVAYMGFVHVYRLGRGIRVALGEPEAILSPNHGMTEMSRYVSADINPRCPDAMNHMVVSELGEQEILVVSRDNGDVEAWYTATIAEYIQRNRRARKDRDQTKGGRLRAERTPRQPYPRHFFAQNAGASAWGLAVHKKSRLIAVSSNCHEVTVFAFALNRHKEATSEESADSVDAAVYKDNGNLKSATAISSTLPQGGKGLVMKQLPKAEPKAEPDVLTDMDGPITRRTRANGLANAREAHAKVEETSKQIDMLQKRLQARQRTWRIVLSFGVEASNLPSIAICDDADGNASRIAAIDINGCLYVADIWKIARKPLKFPPHNVQFPGGRRYRFARGWNVLPVMDAQLLPTDTVHAALGLHPDKCVLRAKTARGSWQDISKCMPEVRYDAASRRHKHRIAAFETEDFSEDTDGIARETFSPVDSEETNLTPRLSDMVWNPAYDPNDSIDLDRRSPVRLAMTILPSSGFHFTELATAKSMVDFAGSRGAARRAHDLHVPLNISQFRQNAQKWNGEDLLRDISFLRFNEEDVEMLAPGEGDTGVVCHHMLDNVNTNSAAAPWDMAFGKRCSMLLTIPELHLVIMGSMCGRVALLTLTKPPQAENVPRRAFRVDAVLPFQYEEETAERPYVCLLGIAVSPMPESRSRGLELRRRQKVGKGGTRLIEPGPPRRWRLILNYQDHTIMQYDIMKRDKGETASWDGFAGSKVYSCRRYKTKDSDTDSSDSDAWADTSEDEDVTVGTDHDPHEHMVAEGVVDEMMDDLAQQEIEGVWEGMIDNGEEIDFPDMQIA